MPSSVERRHLRTPNACVQVACRILGSVTSNKSVLGWVFGAAAKKPLKVPESPIGAPGFGPSLHFQFQLPMHPEKQHLMAQVVEFLLLMVET